MITSWQLYWLTRLDGVVGFSIAVALLIGIVLFVVTAMKLSEGEAISEWYTNNKKAVNISLVVFLLSTTIALFVPCTKEMAVIWVVPKIVNNEKVQQIPSKLIDLANKKLEEWVK